MKAFISSRIGIALSVAIAIIAVATASKLSMSSPKEERKPDITIDRLILASLDKDDDDDGLKNWEEDLYKTDPNNADTDGDGVGDNEEAILGQDPTTAEQTSTSTESTKVVFTPTDKLSQEIFLRYVEAKQLGLEIDEEISADIAESILYQDYSDIKEAYIPADIKTAEETLANIKKYGNDLGRTLSTPRTTRYMELEIFPRLATEPVEDYVDDFNALKARYVKIRDSILAMPTPKPLAKAQSQLANAIGIFIDAIDGGLAIESDPIGSLTKIGRYSFGLESVEASLLEIRAYLKANGVTYSTYESGYVLFQ